MIETVYLRIIQALLTLSMRIIRGLKKALYQLKRLMMENRNILKRNCGIFNKKYGCTNVSVCELFGNSRTIEFTSPKKGYRRYFLNCSSIPINRTRELLLGFFHKDKSVLFFAVLVHNFLNIDSDGKIYPCHLLIDKKEKYLLGDLTSFNKDEFESKRLRFSEKVNKKSYEQCKKSVIFRGIVLNVLQRKENFNFKDCKKMNENALEIYEELAKSN